MGWIQIPLSGVESTMLSSEVWQIRSKEVGQEILIKHCQGNDYGILVRKETIYGDVLLTLNIERNGDNRRQG